MRRERIRLIWGIFMTLFYLAMAVLLAFSDIFDIRFSFRIIIAILFFVYGIFRGYRVWKTSETDKY